MTPRQYLWCIKTLRYAYNMKKKTGFPASAITAQARLESHFGVKIPIDLYTGKRSNNLFGIKCLVKDGKVLIAGNNGYVIDLTREWDKKKKEYYITTAHFRAYKTYEDCFLDYVRIIINSKDDNGEQRYREALDHLDDAERYITEVVKAGYCSDPTYLENVILIIRQLNRIPVFLLKL